MFMDSQVIARLNSSAQRTTTLFTLHCFEADLHDLVFCFGSGQNENKTFLCFAMVF